MLQTDAGSSALASREEETAQLLQQLQQAEGQVVSLQEAQAAMAADAAAKAAKLAHVEGAPAPDSPPAHVCCILALPKHSQVHAGCRLLNKNCPFVYD